MQKNVWAKYVTAIPEVDKALAEQEELKLQLLNSKHVTVDEMHEKWYVGFHTFGMKGILPHLGMNLDLEEWNVLKERADLISEEFTKFPQPKKRKGGMRNKHDEQILRYKWFAYISDRDLPEYQGTEWFFTKETAQLDMAAEKDRDMFIEEDDRNLIWAIKQEYGKPPSIFDITEEVYIFLMRLFARQASIKRCSICKRGEGNIFECPHVVDEQGVLNTYYGVARGEISVRKMVRVIDKVQSLIGSQPTWNYLYAEAFMEFTNHKMMKQEMLACYEETPITQLLAQAEKELIGEDEYERGNLGRQ